ncbi:MAG TPA: hypothetical protein VF668_17235 [Pyrinomonadaceae bacterium]|jgi:hypothetical protein
MSQARPLDVVIRKVEKGEKPASGASRVVVIDCRKKKAVPKAPLFGAAKFFLVSNTDDARHVAECRGPVCPVADFDTGREIGVAVNYQARVRPGDEERAAEALFDATHPGVALDGLLRKWVAAYTGDDPGDFINNYYTRREALRQFVVRRAEEEAGLTLRVSLALDGEEALATVNVGPTTSKVTLRGSDQEQELRLVAELVVDEADKVNAVLSMRAEERLEPKVVAAARDYLAANVTLHEFSTGLGGDRLRDALREHLDGALRGTGRRVRRLVLDSPAARLAPDDKKFFELKHTVRYEIPEFPHPVEINNTLQMKLTDVALYQAIAPTDPAEWIRKSLNRVVSEELFGKKYINLLLDFRESEADAGGGGDGGRKIAAAIKEKMRAEAASIGYRLEHFISQPRLAPYGLLDNFTIEPEGTFATKVPDVQVRLRIVITAKINDLTDVKEYLNRQENVQRAMDKAALAEAAQYLHGVDPSDFYMHFSYSKDAGAPTIEERLAQRVRERLEKQFKARVFGVVPKPLDDELVERLKALQRSLCPFTAEVNPLRSGERFVFEGDFQITGVHPDGWHVFQSRGAGLEEVKATVERNIRACLSTLSDEELRHPPGGLDALGLRVEQDVNKRLVRGYGLMLSINTFSRHRTESEEGVSEVERAFTRERLAGIEASIKFYTDMRESQSEQLQRLLRRREEIVIAEESDAELDELDEKIKSLQERLAANSKDLVKRQVLKARAETLPDTPRLKRLQRGGGAAARALPAARKGGANGDANVDSNGDANGGRGREGSEEE